MTVFINLGPKRIGSGGADGALRRPLSGPSPSSAVAQPSWLRVHGASQLRVSDRFFRKSLRDCLKMKFWRSSSSSSSNLGLKKAPKLSAFQYVSFCFSVPVTFCHFSALPKPGAKKGQNVPAGCFVENLCVDARLTASAPSSRRGLVRSRALGLAASGSAGFLLLLPEQQKTPPVGEKVAAGRMRGKRPGNNACPIISTEQQGCLTPPFCIHALGRLRLGRARSAVSVFA